MMPQSRELKPIEYVVGTMVLAILVLAGVGVYGLSQLQGDASGPDGAEASAGGETAITELAQAIESAGAESGIQPVDQIDYVEPATAVIWTDPKWAYQSKRVRRSLARSMLATWRDTVGESGRIVIYDQHGNKVGGTRLTGSAWVED